VIRESGFSSLKGQDISPEGVTGDQIKFNNEELHNLFFSPNFIAVIKLETVG
jgi:hypothetical protein